MASKGLPPLFTVKGLKDHPAQEGLLTFSRTRLVLLLCLAACTPLIIEHLFMYEFAIGTITHTSAMTEAAPRNLMDRMERLAKESPGILKARAKDAVQNKGKKKKADKKLPKKSQSADSRHADLLNKLHLAEADVSKQANSRFKEVTCAEGMPFPVLPRRVQTFKSSGDLGFFAQHPQFEDHWYEVVKVDETSSAKVFGYKVLESDDSMVILEDKSTPRRPKYFLRVVMGEKVEQASSKDGPWTKAFDLKPCDDIDGCLYIADYGKKLRKVWKFKGGAMTELCDGQIWAESNQDAGPPLFWFGHLYEDKRHVVAYDASRDIWIMIKPPPPSPDAPPMTPRELSTAVILLAIGGQQKQMGDDKWAPWSQLGQPCDPKLTCMAARKRMDAELKAKKAGPPLHMIFNVDTNKKYNWLVQFFAFWWNQSQDKSRGSTFTRLLTADKPDDLMDKIPTFLCKPPKELMAQDHYVPYNKITSVMEWIQAKHAELPKDQIVVIIDVDVVLLEDVSYFAVDVKKGMPLGAKGFMSFTGEDTPMDRMIKRYCKGCDAADPMAVPYFIHKDDLLALAPKWLEKAREIRKDTTPWSSVKDWRSDKPVQLSWTAEQWAYLLSAAEMGLRHEVRDDISAFTGCGVLQLQEPMIHYSDWTKGLGKDGKELKWNKGRLDAVASIPNHDPKNQCEIDKVMIQKLQEARAALFPELKPSWAEA